LAELSRTPEDVARHAARVTDLPALDAAVSDCFACPRLVAWREEVARVKRSSFRDQTYWGRPIQ
jgi:uracil-DNA glycosylase